jgi:hypothetical protein
LIDHPFLSFKQLSEEELLDKTSDLHKKLAKAHMWGSSQEIIDQLYWMLEMIEEEKGERLKKQQFEMVQAMFPETTESDPDFVKNKSEMDDSNTKVVKPAVAKKNMSLPAPTFHKEYISPKDKK